MFSNGEMVIVCCGHSVDVNNQETEHGLLNMIGQLESFSVSFTGTNSLFSDCLIPHD